MADQKDKTKGEEVHEDIHKIRMTLRGREIKPLEHACAEIIARAKQQGYEVRGAKRIPTKVLTVTTRRSPCGNGTNTYDHYEMRIHKRIIDLHAPAEVVKSITTIDIEAGVEVEVRVLSSAWAALKACLFFTFVLSLKCVPCGVFL